MVRESLYIASVARSNSIIASEYLTVTELHDVANLHHVLLDLHEGTPSGYENFSNTIVAWMRSPPPRPLLPEAAVVIVCNRYPKAA